MHTDSNRDGSLYARIPYGCLVVSFLACLLPTSLSLGASPRNVLIIMADDCTYSDLPQYGGTNAVTPNLDAFAKQSLVFNNAFLCSAMCQPCRAELYTGQYPMRNGCAWNHSASRSSARSLPHYFGQAGYRVGIAGKVHVSPTSVFPFEQVGGFDKNCVRNPTQAHDISNIYEFMTRDTKQPFCLVVALVEPHVPWVMGDPTQYPPKKIDLPPNIADTPRTRQDFGKYLAEITYMDGQVGEILTALETSGESDSTIVMFTSEQGSQFPGCKWTNWNTGVHTALMVRGPEDWKRGDRTDALVQYADITPTLLDLCDIQPAEADFDGTSFAPVILGESDKHRDYVYFMHNNYPEGPPYPIRSISDGQYHYIRNLLPNEMYIEKHLMGVQGKGVLNNPYWGTWIWHSTNDPRTYALVKRYTQRPAEQFFDMTADPYEMDDLSQQAAHSAHIRRLSDELDRWMAIQGDPGVEQDTQASHQAAKDGQHRFFPPEE